jgi:hypothetical protein
LQFYVVFVKMVATCLATATVVANKQKGDKIRPFLILNFIARVVTRLRLQLT